MSAQAQALLSAFRWPGNVRQLENAIFRAVVLADGERIGVGEFPQISAQLGPDAAQPLVDPSPALAAAWPDVREATEFAGQNAPPLTTASLRLLDAQGEVRPLEEIERDAIRFAIAHYREQMSEVARRLKIGRSTLYRKLEGLGLDETPREAAVKEDATV
jgi:DNA-binding NtrC family response regulator